MSGLNMDPPCRDAKRSRAVKLVLDAVEPADREGLVEVVRRLEQVVEHLVLDERLGAVGQRFESSRAHHQSMEREWLAARRTRRYMSCTATPLMVVVTPVDERLAVMIPQ